MKPLNIAITAAYSAFGDVARNLRNIRKWTARAKRKGAHIVAFPENMVQGQFRETYKLAEPIPSGPSTQYLLALAREYRIYVSTGICEKARGQNYVSNIIVGPEGLVSKYRKIHVCEYNCTNGTKTELVKIRGYMIGIQICRDFAYPEPARMLALDGADLILHPAAFGVPPKGNDKGYIKPRDYFLPLCRSWENAVFYIHFNQAGDHVWNGRKIHFPGNIVAASPDEYEIIRRKDKKNTERQMMATIDLNSSKTYQARKKGNYFINDRYPPLYKRLVQGKRVRRAQKGA